MALEVWHGLFKRIPRAYTSGDMTAEEGIASVASQLAALTHTVEEMAGELKEVRERA